MLNKKRLGKKIKFSFASYVVEKGSICDLNELANILSNCGEIPKNINDTKAMELSLLAQGYLRLLKNQSGIIRTVKELYANSRWVEAH